MKIIDQSHHIESDLDVGCVLRDLELWARNCYKSEEKIGPGTDERLVRSLLHRSPPHEGVLEHHSLTVRFVTDRGVTHELVRHRLASYLQESTRYCNYGHGDGEVTFIRPVFWDQWRPAMRDTWFGVMAASEEAYLNMINSGLTPQEARTVLPNSLKTEIIMTANLREWRMIFGLRTTKNAHPQMIALMRPLLRELRTWSPVLFDDVGEVE